MNVIDFVERPTLLVDENRAKANIAAMANKATMNGVRFRPHFKTHQSAEIGEWFRDVGVDAITVSSVEMARYFSVNGWLDVLIAFPVNLRQMAEINRLAREINLGVLVESLEAARKLAEQSREGMDVWIEIDAGYHRTGVTFRELDVINQIARLVGDAPELRLKGLLTHSGNAYGASPADLEAIFTQTRESMDYVRRHLSDDFPGLAVSVGDTPTCSQVENLTGVDEIRPGNFVFYDLMQLNFHSCVANQIAVAVALPVVSKNNDRSQIVVYGGAVHLSKEYLETESGQRYYGRVAAAGKTGWSLNGPSGYVISLSQEHGVIQANQELYKNTEIGDVLIVLPIHSCLTVDLYDRYLTTGGEWFANVHS